MYDYDRMDAATLEKLRKTGHIVPVIGQERIAREEPKKGRYGNVARRTEYNGVFYDSKAEADYAAQLDDHIRCGEVSWWLRQVTIPLGPDCKTRVDFLVGTPAVNIKDRRWCVIHAVEVKGVETREFAKVRKLWPKYGPFPMWIVKRGNAEIIEGKG